MVAHSFVKKHMDEVVVRNAISPHLKLLLCFSRPILRTVWIYTKLSSYRWTLSEIGKALNTLAIVRGARCRTSSHAIIPSPSISSMTSNLETDLNSLLSSGLMSSN
jgi:hypothetical protein